MYGDANKAGGVVVYICTIATYGRCLPWKDRTDRLCVLYTQLLVHRPGPGRMHAPGPFPLPDVCCALTRIVLTADTSPSQICGTDTCASCGQTLEGHHRQMTRRVLFLRKPFSILASYSTSRFVGLDMCLQFRDSLSLVLRWTDRCSPSVRTNK